MAGRSYIDDELCRACGWSSYNETHSSYGPRVKILHTRDNLGLWAVGSQWLLRDQPNDHSLGNDYMTQQFLRDQPNLTILPVKEMRSLRKPSDQICVTLMARAPGVGLDTIWPSLTPEQKSSDKDQLTEIIKQLRRFTAPAAQKVDGSLLDDVVLGFCTRRRPPTCEKIGRTVDEWLDNLAKVLRSGLSRFHGTKDSDIIEEKFQELKANFPNGEPYVLTHGDMNLSNIIVNNDKIEAIIDWEMAGYYPWWVERFQTFFGGSKQTDELFEPLWADVFPDMDETAFRDQVLVKVAPVGQAWRKSHRQHPDYFTSWQRPGFCKCKPYAGDFRSYDLGNPPEHRLSEDEPAYEPWY